MITISLPRIFGYSLFAGILAACIGVDADYMTTPKRWQPPPENKTADETISSAALRIIHINPPPDSWVDGESAIEVQIEYTIKNFEDPRAQRGYTAQMHFMSSAGGNSILSKEKVTLSQPAGTVTLKVPLKEYISHALLNPLKIHVAIHRPVSDQTSLSIGHSDAVHYRYR